MRMIASVWYAVAALVFATGAAAADFGTPGGPQPPNLDAIADVLRQDPYDLELLISYGTSKGGSAGHLALAIRDQAPGDDLVYSANFYADREPEHAKDFYTDDLMARIPKMEYLFGTTSSISDKASFGLDFGEIYKRSVVGIRVYGVPAAEKEALAAYFGRINDDFRRRARDTEYHRGEVKYDYLRLNCAKTIGAAFRHGAGYADLEVEGARLLSGRRLVAAANANVPMEMAMKLLAAWHARGYGLDVVLYKKWDGSTYINPQDEDNQMYKDLPNRFPSVLSLDYLEDQGYYEDYDNLYAMYLLYNLCKYSVVLDGATRRLKVEATKELSERVLAEGKASMQAVSDVRDDYRNWFEKNLADISADLRKAVPTA